MDCLIDLCYRWLQCDIVHLHCRWTRWFTTWNDGPRRQ